MIEQGLKVFTAIYKRIYRALKDEFRLLFELNARHIDEKAYYTFNDEQEVVEKSDYDLSSMDICPVADPKMVTDMQRAGHAQLLMQIAEHPAFGPIQDAQEALKRVYDAMGVQEPDKLFKKQQGRARPNRPSLRNCSPRPPRTCRRAQGRRGSRQDHGGNPDAGGQLRSHGVG
jgi:chaperonin GroES